MSGRPDDRSGANSSSSNSTNSYSYYFSGLPRSSYRWSPIDDPTKDGCSQHPGGWGKRHIFAVAPGTVTLERKAEDEGVFLVSLGCGNGTKRDRSKSACGHRMRYEYDSSAMGAVDNRAVIKDLEHCVSALIDELSRQGSSVNTVQSVTEPGSSSHPAPQRADRRMDRNEDEASQMHDAIGVEETSIHSHSMQGHRDMSVIGPGDLRLNNDIAGFQAFDLPTGFAEEQRIETGHLYGVSGLPPAPEGVTTWYVPGQACVANDGGPHQASEPRPGYETMDTSVGPEFTVSWGCRSCKSGGRVVAMSGPAMAIASLLPEPQSLVEMRNCHDLENDATLQRVLLSQVFRDDDSLHGLFKYEFPGGVGVWCTACDDPFHAIYHVRKWKWGGDTEQSS